MDQKALPKQIKVQIKGEYLIREVANFIFGKKPIQQARKGSAFQLFTKCSSLVHLFIVTRA